MLTFTYEDSAGNELVHIFPTKKEVCPRCEGEGRHVNPSIDGHGITAEEWLGPDWDDESRETYLAGGYDVPCYECKGLRVVDVPDEERYSEEDKRVWKIHCQTRRERRECDEISRIERLSGE